MVYTKRYRPFLFQDETLYKIGKGENQMDGKTMATTSGAVGRDVPATKETDTPAVPGDYHNYQGSQAKMFETYSNRMSKLEEALGNKDSVKG